jgi:positive regulator of sigma E activity
MMESLMTSDLSPIFIVFVFGTGVFLFMTYYTRELREPASQKKKRSVAVR